MYLPLNLKPMCLTIKFLGTRHHVGKKDGGSYITAGKLYIMDKIEKSLP
jgi:hypothetical protein